MTWQNIKRKIIGLILIIAIGFGTIGLARPAQAILPVEDIPAALWDSAMYLLEKSGTIFFQNILRKTLNQFAYDYGTYIGSGNRGQNPLYITESWDNFWKGVGDKATGDFIETFANSVISDIAANEIAGENKAKCDEEWRACLKSASNDTAIEKCNEQQKTCLSQSDSSSALAMCQDSFDSCEADCKTYSDSDEACLQNCEVVYAGCTNNISQLDVVKKQNSAMLGTGSPLAKINICNPSLSVAVSIGLGLTRQQNPNYKPNCTFSQMKKNWSTFADKLQDMADPQYLNNLINQFDDPYNSDLGVTLKLYSGLIEYRGEKIDESEKITVANKGWLDLRDLSGGLLGTPGEAEQRKQLVGEALFNNLGTVTGDILVDAANIFLNQAAITWWNSAMGNLSSSGFKSLGYWDSPAVGRSSIENRISKLKEPTFSEHSRLNLLAELANCPTNTKAGPTNCVINERFGQAVTEEKTLTQAIRDRNLPGEWPFGFNKRGQENLDYNQGYPYRSILILRKYRIIPVGWELAAQKIQQLYLSGGVPNRPDGVSLQDLIDCYHPSDDFVGYGTETGEEWCWGLVDPYWVLKLPAQYCAAQGYGPKLMQEPTSIATGTKYCSADEGKTQALIDGEVQECTTDLDCCTASEKIKRNQLDPLDPKYAEKVKNICSAKCAYNEYELQLSRQNDYCADEQGCIKEDDNGNCLFYGYCTQERREWNFTKDSKDKDCAPVYNSCQTFKSSRGVKVSFLQNTLNYGCSANSIGCLAYALTGDYTSTTKQVAWNGDQVITLNGQAKDCRTSAEGCHEFINVAEGVNLIPDASFDDVERWKGSGRDVININDAGLANRVYSQPHSLRVIGQNGLIYSLSEQSIMPAGFNFELDQYYTLSAYIYVAKGYVNVSIGNTNDADSWQTVSSTNLETWEQYIITINNDFTVNANSFKITGQTADTEFYVDNIEFSLGRHSNYDAYRASSSLLYQKFLPDYLAKECYVNPPKDYSLRDDAPAECANYSRYCNADEVGCQIFTEVKSKDQTAAKVKPKDYCPQECVGYDTFIQQQNYFYSPRPAYFIPSTAKACSAQVAGCSLLVNLDKLAQGGESNEYYASLRQCQKPDNSCAEFYTWEGSDQTGYQLVVFNLKENTAAGISQPAVTITDDDPTDYYDGSACNELIYGLKPNHPSYNPDCRQFYGRDGNISYHLYSKTISCTDECYPYRHVVNNYDVNIDTAVECSIVKGHWDETKQACVVCQNGGVWQEEHQACVYYAMPSKSQTCKASEVGCGEYTGNFSNNIKLIVNNSFEDGLGNWQGGALSSDALVRGGHSFAPTSTTAYVPAEIKANLSYELSFMAKKTKADAKIASIGLAGVSDRGTPVSLNNNYFVKDLALTADWQEYKFVFDPGYEDVVKYLLFEFSGKEYRDGIRLDNIKLKEFSERYYLIKDSWTTPDSCNRDYQGLAYPLYMLGCKQYTDSLNKTHYLRSFSQLCQSSVVGCQAVIDTYNSSYYGSFIYNDYNGDKACGATEVGCVDVPADNFAYIVYDPKKSCSAQDKGCQRLGRRSLYGDNYADAYLINNPDDYSTILCSDKQVGCDSWTTTDGSEVYFKNPGKNVCEYRQYADGTFAWFKKKMQYCGASCTTDADCAEGQACRLFTPTGATAPARYCLETNVNKRRVCSTTANCQQNEKCTLYDADGSDEVCELDYENRKTIGLGVPDEAYQPVGMMDAGDSGNVGLCPSEYSGCTEYIDPDSRINGNIAKIAASQKITLPANILYIVKAARNSNVTIKCATWPLYYINNTNNLLEINPAQGLQVVANYSEEFYLFAGNNTEAECTIDGEVEYLRPAVMAYKLKQTLDDERPTEVNFDNGQILFNERGYNGVQLSSLLYNTIATMQNTSNQENPSHQQPMSLDIIPPGNNANILLKVSPNRTCEKWLGCKSYSQNPLNPKDYICYERGLCNQMNEAGECVNFLNTFPLNQMYSTNPFMTRIEAGDLANMTGYVKVGYEGNINNSDYYRLADMTQVGDTKIKFDGTFEDRRYSDFYRGSSYGQAEFVAPVISDARLIEQELGYAQYQQIPDGQSIAKSKDYVAIDVYNVGGQEYVVSAYVFMRYGQKIDLSVGPIGRSDNSCPFVNDQGPPETCVGGSLIVATTNKQGEWVRLVGKFNMTNSYVNQYNAVRIGLYTDGLMYFDDVRLEPGLTIRSKTGSSILREYLHSSCRLYPERDALSCDYYQNNGLRRKGWSGYCLEFDPRDKATCLMWYPLDKVEAEEFEEGAALDFAKDIYYCIDALDECNVDVPVQPEMFCRKFIKVDKDKYWYNRLTQGSGYTIPAKLLSTSRTAFTVDFGVDTSTKIGGKKENFQITQNISNNSLYGAYSTKGELGDDKLTTGTDSKGQYVLPFLPYFGYSRSANNGKDDPYFCRATIDEQGHSLPIEIANGLDKSWVDTISTDVDAELGVYDGCYVQAATQLDCDKDGKNQCCQWDWRNEICSNFDELDYTSWFPFPENYGKTFICTESNETDSCINQNRNPYFRYNDEPDTRCNVYSPAANANSQIIMGRATDTKEDSFPDGNGDVACYFSCFNFIKKYDLADSDNSNGVKAAINRLFIGSDQGRSCWEWSDTEGKYKTCASGLNLSRPSTECPASGRPVPDPNNPAVDFCVVYPKVSLVKANKDLLVAEDPDNPNTSYYYKIKTKGWLPIYFNSTVDDEQLPLRKYTVNLGFSLDNQPVTLVRNVNMYDRRPPTDAKATNNPHIVNYFLEYNKIRSGNSGLCNDTYCQIRPSVFLEDNWGLSGKSGDPDSFLDYPIRIYK